MKNLEKEIIKRLNKVLNKYNLEIISRDNHNYKTTIKIDEILEERCNKYVLVQIAGIDNDITIIDCHHTWDNIKDIVLEHFLNYSLFNAINDSYNTTKYYDSYLNNKYDKHHILIAKLYNEFIPLNNCSSYEELIIKMDLMGI